MFGGEPGKDLMQSKGGCAGVQVHQASGKKKVTSYSSSVQDTSNVTFNF